MNQSEIQRFIEFVELDQRLDRLIHEQASLASRGEQIKQEIDAIKKETGDALRNVTVVRKQIDSLELELKAINEKLKEKQTKLNRAASPKEFFSLEHEIEDLTKKVTPLDEQGLQLLTDLDEVQKVYDQIKEQEPEKITALEQTYEQLIKDLHYGEGLVKAYKEQKAQEESAITPELRAHYQQMKERVTNPVVPLLRGSCSACFYAVNQPDIIEASHGKLITCRDCYRSLYSPQAFNHEDKEVGTYVQSQ